jgi:hypothetical protein
MNITVSSDQPVAVKIFLTFIDGNVFEFQMRLEGRAPAMYCVVGRWPQDIVRMELQYNGNRFAHPIEVEGENLKTINIYGGRDQWSQMLREKAMES